MTKEMGKIVSDENIESAICLLKSYVENFKPEDIKLFHANMQGYLGVNILTEIKPKNNDEITAITAALNLLGNDFNPSNAGIDKNGNLYFTIYTHIPAGKDGKISADLSETDKDEEIRLKPKADLYKKEFLDLLNKIKDKSAEELTSQVSNLLESQQEQANKRYNLVYNTVEHATADNKHSAIVGDQFNNQFALDFSSAVNAAVKSGVEVIALGIKSEDLSYYLKNESRNAYIKFVKECVQVANKNNIKLEFVAPCGTYHDNSTNPTNADKQAVEYVDNVGNAKALENFYSVNKDKKTLAIITPQYLYLPEDVRVINASVRYPEHVDYMASRYETLPSSNERFSNENLKKKFEEINLAPNINLTPQTEGKDNNMILITGENYDVMLKNAKIYNAKSEAVLMDIKLKLLNTNLDQKTGLSSLELQLLKKIQKTAMEL